MLSAGVLRTDKLADANLGCSFSAISAMLVSGTAASGEQKANELGMSSPPNTQIASAVIRYEPEVLAALPREYLQYLIVELIADRSVDSSVSIPAWMTLINADELAGREVESLDSFPKPKSEGFNQIASFFKTQWETGTSIPKEAVLQTGIPTDGKHIFVIPDLHGELRLLEGALSVIESQIRAQNLDPKDVEIVCLGDYLNKGPDSYGVVRRLIEVSKEFSANSGFSGVSVNFLRGNHEDVEGIGFHLRSLGEECDDEAVWQYAKSFVQVMEKGFAETVRSYLGSEDLSETERIILESFISDYPVIDSGEDRSWTKNGEIINEKDDLSFFREFNRCWQDILTSSGHAKFFDSLEVGAKNGGWVFVHGGLPSEDEQLQQFSQQLQSPDAPHSETMITAACNAVPLILGNYPSIR